MRKKLNFKHRFFKSLLNDKGIALIVLLSFVLTMTPMVLGLMDEAIKNHQVALNTVRRMQSYYLAKSGINFSKMILVQNKSIQNRMKSAGLKSSDLGGAMSEPLYKALPLDTVILKSLLNDSAFSEPRPDEDTSLFDQEENAPVSDGLGSITKDELENENSPDSQDNLFSEESQKKSMNGFDKDKLKEFLSFAGDFRSEITEEYAKYSINTIGQIENTSLSYDIYKKILLNLLLHEDFKDAFEDQERDAENLVHAIGDYMDQNSSINEFDQRERGDEGSLYKDLDFGPKNAKYLTLSELRLVPGMTDRLYLALEPYLTVYQTEASINVCLADPEILKQLILLYTQTSDCTTPLTEDNEDELTNLISLVLGACPDKIDMANALNQSLGIKEVVKEEEVAPDTEDEEAKDKDKTDKPKNSTAKNNNSAKVNGCKVQFVDLLSDKNDIFTIEATGQIEDVSTKIKLVLDTSGSSAKSWTVLYSMMY